MLEAALIGPLVDRLIQFAKERNLRDRNLFKDFVEPVWADFEKVHQAYLDSLKNYHFLVSETGSVLDESHPVFAAIERDAVFTSAQRAYVRSVTSGAMGASQHPSNELERTKRFYSSVSDYLEFPANVALDRFEDPRPPDEPDEPGLNPMFLNVVRRSTTRSLRAIFRLQETEDVRRLVALATIEEISLEVQSNYLHAKWAFDAAKTSALR